MSLNSIQRLQNMEYALYCNYGMGMSNAPSFYNNYCCTPDMSSVWNNYANSYMYGNNPSFGQNTSAYQTQTAETSSNNGGTTFAGLSNQEINQLTDYYAKNNVLEEGFMGAAAGGLSWLAFENAQSIFHPKNAKKGILEAERVFKNVPKEAIKKNPHLYQEAYTAVQQAWRDTGKKGWWSGWLRKPIDEATIKPLIQEMEAAWASGNQERIALATERLQGARGFDGKLIPEFLSKHRTVEQRLTEDSTKIGDKAKLLFEANKGKIGTLVKQSFKKDFWGFMLFETVFSAGQIITAFGKDSETGLKQTGQSLAKAAAGTAGWCLGRAAGTWLGAKAGAAIGTALCPGVGTAIGALIGFTVGSIGMWAGHKLATKIVGADVADKVKAQELAKTQDGQIELLKFAAEKAQKGEADLKTQQLVYKALSNYA